MITTHKNKLVVKEGKLRPKTCLATNDYGWSSYLKPHMLLHSQILIKAISAVLLPTLDNQGQTKNEVIKIFLFKIWLPLFYLINVNKPKTILFIISIEFENQSCAQVKSISQKKLNAMFPFFSKDIKKIVSFFIASL